MANIYRGGVIIGKPKLEVVSSGLQLYIDPSIVAPIGTTVYDVKNRFSPISGATLSPTGATYSTSFGGIINFNGTTGYMNLTSSLSFSAGLTLQIMFKRSNTSSADNVIFSNRAGSKYLLWLSNSANLNMFSIENPNGYAATTPTLSTNNTDWNFITLVNQAANNGTSTIYKNILPTTSSLANSSQLSGTIPAAEIGKDSGGNFRYFAGDVGCILFYSRALSFLEITQNYYTVKGRFGL
jgi:hypothetical protein